MHARRRNPAWYDAAFTVFLTLLNSVFIYGALWTRYQSIVWMRMFHEQPPSHLHDLVWYVDCGYLMTLCLMEIDMINWPGIERTQEQTRTSIRHLFYFSLIAAGWQITFN